MTLNKWPKKIPILSPEQQDAREKWMKMWHDLLPKKFGVIEKFNHGYLADLPHEVNCKTLEIGAGLGEHFSWERSDQDYFCLEYRSQFCEVLRTKIRPDRVICGDIQTPQPFLDGHFNRIIAIHVLEHLPDLPAALTEVTRLLSPGGFFDVVIPCEGGWAYEIARMISSKRLFERSFQMPYMPIALAEHINTYVEIIEELNRGPFIIECSSFFPLKIPVFSCNLCVGLRLRKSGR